MRSTRPLAIAGAAAVLIAAVTVVALSVATGTDKARATLPLDLAKSISSSQVDRSFQIDPENTQEVVLDDGTDVFLVSGDGGDACIGLANGSSACGPASQVASGRLLLITAAATGPPAETSPVPANGSAEATVYSEIVDGIYRVKITTDAQSRRMTEVRFDAAGGTTPAPDAIKLDEPNERGRN